MPLKKRRKTKTRNIKERKAISTRLMIISLKVDDYIYKNKQISVQDAEMYINEIKTFKSKCSDDVRILQVIEKLILCMKRIIQESTTINCEDILVSTADGLPNNDNTRDMDKEITKEKYPTNFPPFGDEGVTKVVEDFSNTFKNHSTLVNLDTKLNNPSAIIETQDEHNNIANKNDSNNTPNQSDNNNLRNSNKAYCMNPKNVNDKQTNNISLPNITFTSNNELKTQNFEKLAIPRNETKTTLKKQKKSRNGNKVKNNSNKVINKSKNPRKVKDNNNIEREGPKLKRTNIKTNKKRNSNKNNDVTDLSWVENIKFVREVSKDEYMCLNFDDSFWNDPNLPVDWNYND